MRRVCSTLIFEFFVETHKLEVMPKLWDSTTEIRKIPAGETGCTGPQYLRNIQTWNIKRRNCSDKH
jgi:hypothetical protein